MANSIAFLASAVIIAAALSGPALPQGTPQTLSIMKVDPQSLATGYRTSKVVGSSVVNEVNETVGTIDDLIVTPGDKVPFAVLSVGGFLGMGTKYVVVPFNSLQVRDNKMGPRWRHQGVAEGSSGIQVQQLSDHGARASTVTHPQQSNCDSWPLRHWPAATGQQIEPADG
jgi:PRC-barrel domain protein